MGCPPQIYLKNDIVIREGEVSREMYFIKSGAVQVGSHFSPSPALFLHAPRMCFRGPSPQIPATFIENTAKVRGYWGPRLSHCR